MVVERTCVMCLLLRCFGRFCIHGENMCADFYCELRLLKGFIDQTSSTPTSVEAGKRAPPMRSQRSFQAVSLLAIMKSKGQSIAENHITTIIPQQSRNRSNIPHLRHAQDRTHPADQKSNQSGNPKR